MTKNFPKEIEQIKKDIEELRIQGATNVAISTFEGMKLFLRNKWGNDSINDLVKSALEVGEYLSNARENEPLARNGVLYIKKKSENLYMEKMDIRKAQDRLLSFIDEYLDIISGSKKELVKNSADDLREFENVLTHCHSSTVVELFRGMSRGKKKSEFGVICTETRPKFQGRVTAKALLDIGIDTTLISDSAAESFAIGRGSRPIDAIFLGCDQITRDGYMINKIGSWGIAMAAHYANKPVYVVTPLLKMDPKISASEVEIEVREEEELWSNAPEGLEMYNPSFEIIDNILITGYITEEGILKANELEEAIRRRYQWLFEE